MFNIQLLKVNISVRLYWRIYSLYNQIFN